MSICLCVQIKGGPNIGHLLESNLSRHTFSLHINGPFQKTNVIFIAIVLYRYDGNMDTVWRRVYDTYLRDSGYVHYKLSHNFLLQRLSRYGGEPQQTLNDT